MKHGFMKNKKKTLINRILLTCLCEASLTFNNLPRRGNTPYLSRPMTPRPDKANDLAESPSVNIKVQSMEFFVPASLASSNFGTPTYKSTKLNHNAKVSIQETFSSKICG